MKCTRAFSLALAACLGLVLASARAAEPKPLVLEEFSYGAILTLPAATFQGRSVVPAVTEHAGLAVLAFRAADITPDFPRTRIHVVLKELAGVTSLADVKAHFKLEQGIDLDGGEPRLGDPVKVREADFGRIVDIDIAQVGWVPGNTWCYVLVSAQAGGGRARTYFVGPLWRIDLGLARLRIARGRF